MIVLDHNTQPLEKWRDGVMTRMRMSFLLGGRQLFPDSGGYFVGPTVLDNVRNEMRVARDDRSARTGFAAADREAVGAHARGAAEEKERVLLVVFGAAQEGDDGQDAGGEGGVAGGAAEEVFLRILRGFDIIQGDGSGDDD